MKSRGLIALLTGLILLMPPALAAHTRRSHSRQGHAQHHRRHHHRLHRKHTRPSYKRHKLMGAPAPVKVMATPPPPSGNSAHNMPPN